MIKGKGLCGWCKFYYEGKCEMFACKNDYHHYRTYIEEVSIKNPNNDCEEWELATPEYYIPQPSPSNQTVTAIPQNVTKEIIIDKKDTDDNTRWGALETE